MLGERIFALELVAMVICFSAVVVIALQAHGKTDGDSTVIETDDTSDASSNETFIGLMLALTTGFVMAFCAISTRLLKEVPTPVIIFYHTMGGLVMTTLFILVEMAVTHSPCRFGSYTANEMWIALGASAFDTAALLNVTAAYQADSSGFVGLLSYMNIVYAYMCD